MATKGNTTLHKGIPTKTDAFVVIVKTEWNSAIVNKLETGAKKVLKAANVTTKTITVPGAVEIPFAVKQHYTYSSIVPSAYIVLGTVIQGDTPHFDYVCKLVTDGVLQLNLSLDVPVIFGVLTVLNQTQAIERIGGIHGHKGEEAAITALKMIQLNQQLKK
ncbi:MAG TPA: 6,7-dimethyl-8-ribityllumazine synthase [Chitinophagaceae bacterium]|jgi:6,7-dimethyl-8-ribityllumazine synthase|nr:6,7-dimethyl-8-ribityllumazine synthase [Chitinophagaceae bacterium]